MLFCISSLAEPEPNDEYTVNYQNVSGLKFGTGVYYEGYRVGQVNSIEPVSGDDGMRYLLTLGIARGWKIPKDSVARITSSGLISAPQIGIREGRSAEKLSPGDEIIGAEKQNMFSALNNAASEFEHLSRNGVMPLLENLNRRVDEVAGHVNTFSEKQLTPFMSTFNHKINEEILVEADSVVKKLNNSAAPTSTHAR